MALPPTSASVGVWADGAGAPIVAVVPGSSAVNAAEPVTAVPPEVVETWSRQAPGDGIASSAT